MVIEVGFEPKFGNLLFGPWPSAACCLQPAHGLRFNQYTCSQLALVQISLDSGCALMEVGFVDSESQLQTDGGGVKYCINQRACIITQFLGTLFWFRDH